MRSRIDQLHSLDAYLGGIRETLPAVDALIQRHEAMPLRDYVETLTENETSPWQGNDDFVAEVANYTRETLGPELGSAIAAELHENPQVLTANHHGIDTFAQSTQSNLLFSLRKRADGTTARTIPVLACGSVPLNNLTYPRGLLVYACNDAGGADGICKLPVFPDSHKRKLVSAAAPFDAAMLERARNRAKKLVADEKLLPAVEPALERVFAEFDQLGADFPDYSRQATVVNQRLWRRLFRGSACRSDLVYIELERIASRLLQYDLYDPAAICHQLLFDPLLRRCLVEKLDGQRGCWQREKLLRRGLEQQPAGAADSAIGTMFFWGVDAKGRQVPLAVAERGDGMAAELRGVDAGGNRWSVALTPDAIARELGNGRLLPSIFTSYLLIAVARGVSCIGGYYQADYLPTMRRAVHATLRGGRAEAVDDAAAGPDLYLSGMQAVGFRADDRLLPAGPVEIIASGGFDDDQYQRIGEVTVLHSHIASMFDFVMDLAPGSHDPDRVKRDLAKLVQARVGDKIVTISMDCGRAAG